MHKALLSLVIVGGVAGLGFAGTGSVSQAVAAPVGVSVAAPLSHLAEEASPTVQNVQSRSEWRRRQRERDRREWRRQHRYR